MCAAESALQKRLFLAGFDGKPLSGETAWNQPSRRPFTTFLRSGQTAGNESQSTTAEPPDGGFPSFSATKPPLSRTAVDAERRTWRESSTDRTQVWQGPSADRTRTSRGSGTVQARFQRSSSADLTPENCRSIRYFTMLHLRHEDDHLTSISSRILAIGPERRRNGPRVLPHTRAAGDCAVISRHARSSARLERNLVLTRPRSRASRPSKQRRAYGSANAIPAKRVFARVRPSGIRRTPPRHKPGVNFCPHGAVAWLLAYSPSRI